MNIVDFKDLKQELALANQNVKVLKKNLKTIETMEFEVNHQLENETRLSASDGYKFAKSLKDIRNKRRVLKDQILEQQAICDTLKPFIDTYEKTQDEIQTSHRKGIAKYVKNFDDINNRLAKIKTL